MGIKVIGKRVLVKPYREEKEKSSLILVPNEKKVDEIFEVVGVNKETPKEIKIGSKIICTSQWLQNIKYENQEFFIVPVDNIIAIMEIK